MECKIFKAKLLDPLSRFIDLLNDNEYNSVGIVYDNKYIIFNTYDGHKIKVNSSFEEFIFSNYVQKIIIYKFIYFSKKRIKKEFEKLFDMETVHNKETLTDIIYSFFMGKNCSQHLTGYTHVNTFLQNLKGYFSLDIPSTFLCDSILLKESREITNDINVNNVNQIPIDITEINEILLLFFDLISVDLNLQNSVFNKFYQKEINDYSLLKKIINLTNAIRDFDYNDELIKNINSEIVKINNKKMECIPYIKHNQKRYNSVILFELFIKNNKLNEDDLKELIKIFNILLFELDLPKYNGVKEDPLQKNIETYQRSELVEILIYIDSLRSDEGKSDTRFVQLGDKIKRELEKRNQI